MHRYLDNYPLFEYTTLQKPCAIIHHESWHWQEAQTVTTDTFH